MIYFLIALIIFLADQGIKYVVANQMELHEQIPVIGNFFLITSHRNSGAAFGILQGQRGLFILITLIVIMVIIGYIRKAATTGQRFFAISLSMVLGGAVGNFLDRARTGEVVDFAQFNFGSYTFPIFNVADSAIVVGVVMILLDLCWESRRPKEMDDKGEKLQPHE